MKLLKLTSLALFALFAFTGFSQIECTNDVTIAEGTSITMCSNALESLNASSGYVSYSWSGPETGSGQTWIPNFSGQYVVAATDGVGCVSHDTIQVTINPSPVDAIISSEGDTICPGSSGTVLSLSNPYILYDWGNGNTSPTLTVTESGTYSVDVADANSCVETFTFTVTSFDFDLQQTAAGGCEGPTVTLTASGGGTYLWSTGETGSTIVVNPSSTTNYSVQITNGSCSQQLSTAVTVDTTQLGFDLGDTIFVAAGDGLTLEGPDGFFQYDWSPANAFNDPGSQNPTYVSDQSQLVTLTATHSNGCVLVDSVMIVVVDLTIPNGFSPNTDGINNTFVVPELNVLSGALTVWNRWGDIVFESAHYENDWDGTCKAPLCMGGSNLPEGTYFYLIDVNSIIFKGYVTLKRKL
jgi:gliding motility-associated-like protein